jgi:hypothetical protein
MKDTVSHYVPPHSPLTSTEPQVFSNNLTMPLVGTLLLVSLVITAVVAVGLVYRVPHGGGPTAFASTSGHG